MQDTIINQANFIHASVNAKVLNALPGGPITKVILVAVTFLASRHIAAHLDQKIHDRYEFLNLKGYKNFDDNNLISKGYKKTYNYGVELANYPLRTLVTTIWAVLFFSAAISTEQRRHNHALMSADDFQPNLTLDPESPTLEAVNNASEVMTEHVNVVTDSLSETVSETVSNAAGDISEATDSLSETISETVSNAAGGMSETIENPA